MYFENKGCEFKRRNIYTESERKISSLRACLKIQPDLTIEIGLHI